MKKLLLLLFIVTYSVLDLSAQTSVPNSIVIFNGSKYKTLHTWDTSTFLQIVSRIELSDYYYKVLSTTGQLVGYSDSTLVIFSKINTSFEKFVSPKKNHCDSSHFFKDWNYINNKNIVVRMDQIESLTHQSYRAQIWETGGYIAIVFGSLTSLVIAPLISINYIDGGFNSQRYFKTVAVGFGMLSVGIPLAIFNKEKHFNFKHPQNKEERKLWKIDFVKD